MSKLNKVVSLCVDEDMISEVEVCDVGEYVWLGYMLSEGESESVCVDDMKEKLKDFVEEISEGMSEKDVVMLNEKVCEFEEKLKEVVGDESEKMIVCYDWSVEYDRNLSVVVCNI